MTPSIRRGLVLGGGGVLGAAWLVGALQALQNQTGVESGPLAGFHFDYQQPQALPTGTLDRKVNAA